ncbi:MAG: helix-turn-helix domain-containing protein [Chloroflexi bacterium]|nr:helix-turn-helix domain-containing protein [Chloroflexota bacterium]
MTFSGGTNEIVADLLPEYSVYHDEGCDLFSLCLDCPLPRCRYDEKVGRKRIDQRLRNARMAAQHKQGVSVAELAERFRVSKRTVQRVLKKELRE